MKMKDYVKILKESFKNSLITLDREILNCPKCTATVIDDGSKWCWNCGVEILESEVIEYEQ